MISQVRAATFLAESQMHNHESLDANHLTCVVLLTVRGFSLSTCGYIYSYFPTGGTLTRV